MPRLIQLRVGSIGVAPVNYQRSVTDNVNLTDSRTPVLTPPESGTTIPVTIPFTVGA